MIGVEAMFSRGRDGVMDQLRDACRRVLGGEDAPRKLFNRAYEFRSAFVHGRQNFAGPHMVYDGAPEVEKFGESLGELCDFRR
jgi:hypothetical protein